MVATWSMPSSIAVPTPTLVLRSWGWPDVTGLLELAAAVFLVLGALLLVLGLRTVGAAALGFALVLIAAAFVLSAADALAVAQP